MNTIVRPKLWLSLYFLVTRLVLWNVRPFAFRHLYSNMHFLDIQVLQHQLLHGLYYFHTQPPLFNVFLGLVVKSVPEPYWKLAFTGLYSLMGLSIVLGSFQLMRYLKVSQSLALVVAAGLAVFPSMIQGETWLYYAYPVGVLLLYTAIFLFKAVESASWRWGAGYLILLMITVLTRSAFHVVVWMLPLVILLLWAWNKCKGPRTGALVLLGILTLGIASYPFVLNYKRFGVFQSSTWKGISAYSMTFFVSIGDPAKVEKLIADKKVTPLARILRTSPVEVYLDYYMETGKTGVDLWDNPHDSTGSNNFLHFIYPRSDAEIFRNSVVILKEYPWDYVKAVLNETYLFCGFSPYRYFFNDKAWAKPRLHSPMLAVYDVVMVYLVPPVLAVVFVFAFLGYGRTLRRVWVEGGRELSSRAALLFILFTLTYLTAETLLIVFGEANYVRIPSDPLFAVGLALAIQHRLDRRHP